MGRLNTSTFILSIIGIVVCFFLGVKLQKEGKNIYEIVSAVGSVASFFGLAIAILQITSLKKITEATNLAVEETKAGLIQSISISDVSKAIRLIEQIQMYAGHKKFESAHLRLQDLRILLIQFKGNAHFVGLNGKDKYDNLLADVGIHISNLYNTIFMKEKSINVAVLNQTLEDVGAILVTFENQLKFSRGDDERKTLKTSE
jgi:hypothetical protein